MISREKLTSFVRRSELLSKRLTEEAGSAAFVGLAKEFSDLEPIATASQLLLDLLNEQESLEALMENPEEDEELASLAAEEHRALLAKIEAENQALQVMLLPKDLADDRGVILEIRAGTGGDEAGLFAGDLYRMYLRHLQTCGWKVEVMLEREGAVGGYKEVTLSVTGKGAYGRLKFESGVHRVQRVPETESGGRIHTSAATVAVMPEAEDIDVDIEEKDLRIDVFRASGAGGQHVNKTDSAVRITHLPTGIVVVQQDNRSQHRNRDTAMKILRAKLFEEKRDAQEKVRASERKNFVGSGDRSERIRTYNFPQGRISDHRINLTLYKLEQILMGEGLDEIIDALLSDHQAKLLAASADELA